MEVVASLSQGRTVAAQCGLFTYKSVPVIFEPPCISGTGNAKFDQNVINSFRVVISRDQHKLVAVSLQRTQIDTSGAHGGEAAVRHPLPPVRPPTPTPSNIYLKIHVLLT